MKNSDREQFEKEVKEEIQPFLDHMSELIRLSRPENLFKDLEIDGKPVDFPEADDTPLEGDGFIGKDAWMNYGRGKNKNI